MGVRFEAEGLPYEQSYDCGYATYGLYRLALAHAISPAAALVLRELWLGDMPVDGGGMASFRIRDDDVAGHRPDVDAALGAIAAGMPSARVTVPADGFPAAVTAPFGEVDAFLRAELGDACCGCLFYAPDTEGELTGEECAALVADIEAHLDGREPPHVLGHNYGETSYATDEEGRPVPVMRGYDMHGQFMGMFRHCAERGVRLAWH